MAQTLQGPRVDSRPLELRSIAKSIEPMFPSAAGTLRAVAKTLEQDAAPTSRERVAAAIEAQIRQLRAVPSDVTDVPREAMAMDLQNLADDVRRGRYDDEATR